MPSSAQAAGPVVRQQVGQTVGELLCSNWFDEHLEADQQEEEIGDDHPFVLEVAHDAAARSRSGNR